MQNGGGVVAVSAEQNIVKEKTPRGTIEFLWSRWIQFGAPAPVLLPGNQPAFADMGREGQGIEFPIWSFTYGYWERMRLQLVKWGRIDIPPTWMD